MSGAVHSVPQMLTLQEVADRLRIHRRTAERMVRSGELPGRKVRNSWRVHPDQLDAYMRAGAA